MLKKLVNNSLKISLKKSLLLAVGFIMGVAVSSAISVSAKDRYQDLQLFAKVLNLVEQYYVENVDITKLIYGGIKGVMRELDPHSNFLTPEIFKEFETETSGQFGGIGIEITVQDGILTVISPIEDTPAWNAGIRAGDKVIAINGESTKGLSLSEAAQKMRGKNGSKVILRVVREGSEKPKDIAVARGVVKVKSVKYTNLDDGYAYVRLTSFIENSASELEKQIKAHEAKHKKTKGLILDLRRNPGGLLDQAVQVSDLFLEKGSIVSTMGRNEKEKEIVYAKASKTPMDFPLVILIDEYSASASEIVAGALQDNGRALIMGQRSFGKGSVQSVVKLGDGSGLKLTVARYYTPKGRSIQAEGIQPDVEVDPLDLTAIEKSKKSEGAREKDIEGHLLGEKEKEEKKKQTKSTAKNSEAWWEPSKEDLKLSPRDRLLKRDYQVLQAYNYLKAWKVMEKFRPPEAQ